MWSSGKCRTRLLLLLVGALLSGTGAVAVVYAEFRAQAFRPADATNDLVSGEARDPDGDGLVNLRLAAAQVAPPPAEVRWLWFEAESAGGESGVELSNEAMTWVGPGGHLQRSIVVPSAGTYQLWIRKFWNPQAFRWRVGAADAWKDSPAQTLSDLVLLAGNPGRRVGWANVGAVSLLPGTHTFRLEVPAADPNTTAYDCFLLTRDPFTPRGKLKPDEVFQVSQPGWFAFQPAPDPYGFSPIDLRYLNERQAGDHGFVRVEGEDFAGWSTVRIGKPLLRNTSIRSTSMPMPRAISSTATAILVVSIRGPTPPGISNPTKPTTIVAR